MSRNFRRNLEEAMYPANWSDLPADLLIKVLESGCLNTSLDFMRLRSVCRSWRIALPSASKQALFLFESVINRDHRNRPSIARFTLIENTIWSLRSETSIELVHGYETEGGIKALSHPIFQSYGDHHHHHPYSLSMLDVRLIREQARFHVLFEQRFHPAGDSDGPTYTKSSMKALILPTSDWSHRKSTERAVLWLRASSSCVRLWKSGDDNWTEIQGISPSLQDIAIFEGQFVALDTAAALFSVDPSTRRAELLCQWEIDYSDTKTPKPDDRRLVVSGSALYMVEKLERPGEGFKVYRFVRSGGVGSWEELNDLGGGALFWGHRCSFMVGGVEICGDYRPNCVYYHSSNGCLDCNYYYPFINPSVRRRPVVYTEFDLNSRSSISTTFLSSGQLLSSFKQRRVES